MPVLATITVVNLLFGGSEDEASLLSPASLRAPLDGVLSGSEPQLRSTAFALLDRLEISVAGYNEEAVSVMDEYANKMDRAYVQSAQMARLFFRLDAQRVNTFDEVILVRRQLLKLLGPEKWRALFDA